MNKSAQSGTQSTRRSLQILRILAQHEQTGISLPDLVQAAGLERSTTHRLVSCLVEEQFARRDPASKRYHLGVDAMHIGFSTLHRAPVAETLRPLSQRLCRLSGDTVFVVVPQGDHALCLLREHGDFPVRIFTIDVGEKRLLGMGAGGLALLAEQTDEAIAQIHARHAKAYAQSGLSVTRLCDAAARTREQGFSEIVDGITPGVSGVGCSFPISKIARVAISFGAITQRLDAARRKEMGLLLTQECANWRQAID